MRAVNILTGLDCLLWGSLLLVGINLIDGVSAQHAPGYPNSTQILYYIGVPGAVTAALILAAVVFNFVIRSPTWPGILSVVALLPLPVYLLMYGGGV
jgi:hypothetical protein